MAIETILRVEIVVSINHNLFSFCFAKESSREIRKARKDFPSSFLIAEMAVWTKIIFFRQNLPLLPSRLLLSVPDSHRFLRENKLATLADYHRRSGITPCLEDSLLNMYLLQLHYIENERSVNRSFSTPSHIRLKNTIFCENSLFTHILFIFIFEPL